MLFAAPGDIGPIGRAGALRFSLSRGAEDVQSNLSGVVARRRHRFACCRGCSGKEAMEISQRVVSWDALKKKAARRHVHCGTARRDPDRVHEPGAAARGAANRDAAAGRHRDAALPRRREGERDDHDSNPREARGPLLEVLQGAEDSRHRRRLQQQAHLRVWRGGPARLGPVPRAPDVLRRDGRGGRRDDPRRVLALQSHPRRSG